MARTSTWVAWLTVRSVRSTSRPSVWSTSVTTAPAIRPSCTIGHPETSSQRSEPSRWVRPMSSSVTGVPVRSTRWDGKSSGAIGVPSGWNGAFTFPSGVRPTSSSRGAPNIPRATGFASATRPSTS